MCPLSVIHSLQNQRYGLRFNANPVLPLIVERAVESGDIKVNPHVLWLHHEPLTNSRSAAMICGSIGEPNFSAHPGGWNCFAKIASGRYDFLPSLEEKIT